MERELETTLFEKYPKIFRQKDLSKQETAMCWGIACGDGWYNIIDTLCQGIQSHVKWKNEIIEERKKTLVPTPSQELICEASQVKEKFGGLRFYYDGGDEVISGMVRFAEAMSYKVCEWCGNPASLEYGRRAQTRCKKCRNI